MKKVLVVCPNPAIDIFARVEKFGFGIPNRILEEERYPGGKGVHVAMALAEMKIPVTVAGFWGGESGEWLQRKCQEYYPSISFIGPKLKEWTRSCYTFKSDDDFDDTEILGTGSKISEELFQQLMNNIKSILPEISMIGLCGSWPNGSPENGYAQIIKLGKQFGVESLLDCTGIQLQNGLAEKPFGVHLNRKEITEYFDQDFKTAKESILNYCQIAAITDGSKGLNLIHQNGTEHALCRVDQVISTIGSGDCLTAGVIAGLSRKQSLKEVAWLGAACGAANCLRPELGMLYQSDVEALLSKAHTPTS